MPALEFSLDPSDVPLLCRWPGIRTARSFPARTAWHDTPAGTLHAAGRALSTTSGQWRLEALRAPTAAESCALLAAARRTDLLSVPLPDGLGPVAEFAGRRQALQWVADGHTATLRLLDGTLAGHPVCRLVLDGEAAAVTTLAAQLCAGLRLTVPRFSLAVQALAQGAPIVPRALGAPQVAGGMAVSDSLAAIIGHLLDVMLHWAHLVPEAATPEPVHQMRVATRRLRSALSIYKRVAPCPELAGLAVPLRLCAARLGVARDWDVFLGGLGAQLMAAFPDDPRCTAMLRAAAKRRRDAYTDLRGFLGGPDFRTLAASLAAAAALRPWAATGTEELQQDTAVFAAGVLARRMKRVRQAGRGIEALPVPALHELRKDCKRLRYAAEFFAPLFPPRRTKRFLQRLSDLQEELGLLNDSAAVSGLMAQLGRLERSYAAGLVEGFSAAHAGPARARITTSWKRFRQARLFWAS